MDQADPRKVSLSSAHPIDNRASLELWTVAHGVGNPGSHWTVHMAEIRKIDMCLVALPIWGLHQALSDAARGMIC
jgi:hypothetical protein